MAWVFMFSGFTQVGLAFGIFVVEGILSSKFNFSFICECGMGWCVIWVN